MVIRHCFNADLLFIAVPLLLAVTVCFSATNDDSPRSAIFRREFTTSLPHNASSCSDCHSASIIGGSSRVTVTRGGHFEGARFIAVDGGILHSSSTPSDKREGDIENVRGNRVTLSLLGDGLV